MPNLFRTLDGKIWKASDALLLASADGTETQGVWAGSAKDDLLGWWLGKSGSKLTQSEEIAAIASRAEDTGEMVWGDAPAGARLLFVLLAREPGKDYRLAKMVTTAATPAQSAYFRHDRSALFGKLRPDGTIETILPLSPKGPPPKAQGELF